MSDQEKPIPPNDRIERGVNFGSYAPFMLALVVCSIIGATVLWMMELQSKN